MSQALYPVVARFTSSKLLENRKIDPRKEQKRDSSCVPSAIKIIATLPPVQRVSFVAAVVTTMIATSFACDPFLIMSEKDDTFQNDFRNSEQEDFSVPPNPMSGYGGCFLNASCRQQARSSNSASPECTYLPVQPVHSSVDERLIMADVGLLSTPPDVCSGKRSSASRSASLAAKKSSSLVHNMKLPFPWKLYQLLEDMEKTGGTRIVSWMRDGKSFRVNDTEAFAQLIMQRYFRMSKFQSFTRQCKCGTMDDFE